MLNMMERKGIQCAKYLYLNFYIFQKPPRQRMIFGKVYAKYDVDWADMVEILVDGGSPAHGYTGRASRCNVDLQFC